MNAIQLEFDEAFEKRCKYAAEGGFKNIAIAFSYMKDTSDEVFDRAVVRIENALNTYGLKAVQSHAYYYYLLTSSEITEPDAERQILRAIEVSGKLGIEWCVYHPRAHCTGGYSRELSFEDNRKTIARYLKQAEKYNTGIALENLYNWPGVTMYGSDYKDLVELCDSFDSDRVKICWDFGHANLMEFSQKDAIEYMGNRIKCTHIHNNFGEKLDLHLTPDNGTIDWNAVMGALKKVGYSGPMTLETHLNYEDDFLYKEFFKYNYSCLLSLQRLVK